MKHVFELERCQPGQWLFGTPGDGACAIRVSTPGALPGEVRAADRVCILMRGRMQVDGPGGRQELQGPHLVFVPSGQRARIDTEPGSVAVDVFVEPTAAAPRAGVTIASLDTAALEGTGFAWKSVLDRASGSGQVRANLVRVDPGAGSPDRHIHAFDQFYLVFSGHMRVEVGRHATTAGPLSLVVLPAGSVHRNWNTGEEHEQHVALLVPEPLPGEIFDYAVDVHEREAEMMAPR